VVLIVDPRHPSAKQNEDDPVRGSEDVAMDGEDEARGDDEDDARSYHSQLRAWEALAMQSGVEIITTKDETSLLLELVDVVRGLDPDMLLGWNTTTQSWGYVLRRGSHLGIDMPRGLSRATFWGNDRRCQIPGPDSAESKASSYGMLSWLIWITGRITLQLWSVVRASKNNLGIKLFRYNLENVAQNVLKHRLHTRSQEKLSRDYKGGGLTRWDTAKYTMQRVLVALRIFYQLNILGTTAEMARLIGVDFVSVLRRGSQFRVESVMLRITKPRNYVLFRPTPRQVKLQPSLEAQALTREPASGFYSDPVIVLDFQSLYPSVMIAYNLCYSTLIGRLKRYAEDGRMHDRVGVRDRFNDQMDPREVMRLHKAGHLYVAPNGAVFVSHKERKGVLAQMLTELLDTRQMIKKEMKSDAVRNSSSKRLARVLDARQMALKLVSNVTYGYCSASFSGRMPNSALADAIVSIGRSALVEAHAFVEDEASQRRWNDLAKDLEGGKEAGAGNIRAEVLYGDTDSLFIRMKGLKSRDIANDLGRMMADAITERNPSPMKMKFEYVYHPCILQTKKRYVGLQFERKGEPPTLDAKGIESIRVDQCPLTQKLMDRSLRLLFEPPHDIARVRRYVQRHWQKIEQGRIAVNDFVFCKEVRLGSYKEGYNPPAAVVAQKLVNEDPGAGPLYKERVPFLIALPHADENYSNRDRNLAISPGTFVTDISFRINEPYYIRHTKMALHRLFKICGPGLGLPNKDQHTCHDEVNVDLWMKHRARATNRSARIRLAARKLGSSGHVTITHYFTRDMCRLCGGGVHHRNGVNVSKSERGKGLICPQCASAPQRAIGLLTDRARAVKGNLRRLDMACQQCSGCSRTPSMQSRPVPCLNVNCELLYLRRVAHEQTLEANNEVTDAMKQLKLTLEW
jgi:DNA polymerase zeta